MLVKEQGNERIKDKVQEKEALIRIKKMLSSDKLGILFTKNNEGKRLCDLDGLFGNENKFLILKKVFVINFKVFNFLIF